jgi:hypothetical protein
MPRSDTRVNPIPRKLRGMLKRDMEFRRKVDEAIRRTHDATFEHKGKRYEVKR